MHLHKLFMRQGRNYANQENKILRSLLYQKRIKKKSKTEWRYLETFWNRRRKKRKESEKKKKHNERIIKDKIVRDIRILFEEDEQEDYCKPKRVSSFWNNNYI